MKLSIIIPYYNTQAYTDELLSCLAKQITPDIEVIIIDDGSKIPYQAPYTWARVIRQKNKGVSGARNRGLDEAVGEYIAFIDSDDLVTSDYIRQIMAKIKEGCDYIWLSWKTTGHGWQATVKLKSLDDTFPPDNLCVWNRVYRRTLIGNIRFNEKKLIAEDAEFIRLVETSGCKKGVIFDPIYLYRSDTPESLSKRFAAGELNTKRIVYYFEKVTADMTDLIEQFKKDDQEGEVILMTEKNDLPELKQYAMVIPPRRIRATEKKGEPCRLIEIIEPPMQTQVVLWTHYAQAIGGIETFTYYFSKTMSKYYDIIVLYDDMDPRQIRRVAQYVECRKNNPNRAIECDTLIVNRIIDTLPSNVHAKNIIQMVHGAKINYASVPQERDMIVCVSEYVKQSWGELTKDAHVIHNVMASDKSNQSPLLLVTASRLDAPDKGLKRMFTIGHLMDKQNVPYIWLCFSNKKNIAGAPKGIVWMEPVLDIMPWIQKADYLVQLSDEEAFCYSLVEALEVGTLVIVTPLGILDEIGIIDKQNGYVVPYKVPDDFDTTIFLNKPQFEYQTDTKAVISKWRKLLGSKKPKHTYDPSSWKKVKILNQYFDTVLQDTLRVGEIVDMTPDRADLVCSHGYAEEVKV
jgi:Glycosyltransferases involved in cell wall biogenesis